MSGQTERQAGRERPGWLSRTLSVAGNDFLNVRRSKLLWGVSGLYLVTMLMMFYFEGQKTNPSLQGVLQVMTIVGVLIIPLVALVATYLSIAGERESGSIKIRLSLPTTRGQLVAGKFLSRSAAVGVGVLLSLAVAGAYGTTVMDLQFGDYGIFVGTTLLFTLSYVAIATGISALTASRSRAMGAAIGYYLVFNVFWVINLGVFSIDGALRYVVEDLLGGSLSTETLLLVKTFSPGFAYGGALGTVVENFRLTNAVEGSAPVYLEPWFQVVIIGAWLAVPLAVGYLRFRSADL